MRKITLSKFTLVKIIVKLYFLGALAVSFSHIVEASHKLGLHGWQAWTTPFAIDGIAVIGMVMRGEGFSAATRRLGFRVQLTAGLLSLACNVYAGSTTGERIYGVLIVVLFVFSEWLSDRMQSVSVDVERVQAAKRSASAKQAAATRKANAAKTASTGKTRTKRTRPARPTLVPAAA